MRVGSGASHAFFSWLTNLVVKSEQITNKRRFNCVLFDEFLAVK